MNKLFPTYEVGSLPKLNARVKALRGQTVSDEDITYVLRLGKAFDVETAEIETLLRQPRFSAAEKKTIS